jgi:rod shape-determining protein MreD
MTVDAVKAAVLLFLAVLLQEALVAVYTPFGGSADLVLVLLLALALLRGSVFGAFAGFCTGLMLDVSNLGTLGFTSLLLTVGGFWIGRYGETTARDRVHAPYSSVGVVTIIYACAALVLHFVLGDAAPAGAVLSGLPVAVVLNLILTWPVYAAVRRLFRPTGIADRIHEVRLVG